jgi:hypothetical protein
MLSVITLSFVKYQYADCRYAEYHYAECRWAECHHAEYHFADCHLCYHLCCVSLC